MLRTKTLKPFLLLALAILASCSGDDVTRDFDHDTDTDVPQLSEAMAAVRDYVPLYAVVAHRGSTYWAPEETEAAWRWAREMGADYLESDLQASKDGVVLANHDESLQRTTNVDILFGDSLPQTRAEFYRSFRNDDGSQHFSEADIEAQCQRDKETFVPYRTSSYYYHELLMLDAGSWFNAASPQQARTAFSANGGIHQYVSALQDQMAYAEGKMLLRDNATGERILPYSIKEKYRNMTLAQIYAAEKRTVKCDDESVAFAADEACMDFVDYDFRHAYADDPADTGNRPGLYIEFKKPEVNPEDMEVRVYNLLAENGWNILTASSADAPFYVDGKVNVGRTKGRVVLQTFSVEALGRAYRVFEGKVPMCCLLWKKADGTDTSFDTPSGYATHIKDAMERGAHIMGPSIAGEPNNYAELNAPWQAALIRQAGMLNHPYTFDTSDQLTHYAAGDTTDKFVTNTAKSVTLSATSVTLPPYFDGLFTNRTDLTLRYFTSHGYRCNSSLPNPFRPTERYDNSQAPALVPDAEETLQRLGY